MEWIGEIYPIRSVKINVREMILAERLKNQIQHVGTLTLRTNMVETVMPVQSVGLRPMLLRWMIRLMRQY